MMRRTLLVFCLTIGWFACDSGDLGNTGDRCDVHGDCVSELCGNGRCLARHQDADGDGLSNWDEQRSGSDLFNADTDRDGVADIDEIGPDPDVPRDSDGDGVPDFRESRGNDRDRDGIDDENDPDLTLPGSPSTPGSGEQTADAGVRCLGHGQCGGGACVGRLCHAADGDLDGDGLTNGDEVRVGSNPINRDTDGDGEADADEFGDDPDAPLDSDADGRPDVLESSMTDTDGDGIDDEADSADDAPEPDAGIPAESMP